ncbi:C-type lectin domain-containing protein [Caenorhabditis elegans]|uniref:C-type lectin domain-containing protein n=1 Tax=Caenorhabditis elegans TaxID=6239 RepID=Q9XUI6_CAEEL|nr:C-type lectin domain-containing protein [Caenorhabditis elegans]CAB05014.2 C-type lectin domain-containing protein [Caenorhabditis elegans]|eukprot:NP_492871.2 C-type LECtin [Caenorhabditis elegans]
MTSLLVLLAIFIGAVASHGGDYHGRGNGGGNGRGGSNQSNRGCDSGWKRFNRPSGAWCIRIYRGTHSQADAENRCRQNVGATLSGVQNQVEINFITKSALDLISEASGSIWIGGRRTQACRNSALSTSCGSLNSFQWTDGSTTGTAGLVWNTNQPDNKDSRSQQCLVLLASRASSIQDKWTWYANRMDDVQCAASGGESAARALRAYAYMNFICNPFAILYFSTQLGFSIRSQTFHKCIHEHVSG